MVNRQLTIPGICTGNTKKLSFEFWPQTKKSLMTIYLQLQPDGVNLQNFKLWLFDLIEFRAWNSSGLKHRVSEIFELEKHRWQKLEF